MKWIKIKSNEVATPKGNISVSKNPQDGFFGASADACRGCESIPYAIFINNGTDLDRLGENIIRRDLRIGRNIVRMS